MKIASIAMIIMTITQAYFPYNPRTGESGFGISFADQKLDTYIVCNHKRVRAKVYITDLSHVTERYGLMIYISDPNASIEVIRLDKHGRARIVDIEVLEVTSTYKIVDVMDSSLEKILIIVTSPNKNSTFFINIMAICE